MAANAAFVPHLSEKAMTSQDDDIPASYASPPCFMHELDQSYVGLASESGAQQQRDVVRWRKAERERLIAERLTIDSEMRGRHAGQIVKGLDALIENPTGLIVSAYWPFRGEPDLRPWIDSILARGGQFALPVVVERNQPLIFRIWTPGAPLERGVWNIPVPVDGMEVTPDVVVAPVVGFDPACYRLGYGDGFFDRTLDSLSGKVRAVGVGYARSAIPTIYPQPHDIPMEAIVTEREIVHAIVHASSGVIWRPPTKTVEK
jgi:5,10-methenyltetrahydrofolate synthetase